MAVEERLRAGLTAAVSGAAGAVAAADSLCVACVDLLDVDGAALCLAPDRTTRGTLGASSDLSRRLDGMQFTAGHGPCLEAVASGRPVLVADLDDPAELRWPGYTDAVLDAGLRAVFALPVLLSRQFVGALSLYRIRPGALGAAGLEAGQLAAELAALPLLDVIAEHKAAEVGAADSEQDGDDQGQQAALERVEVYQATGMIISALDVDPAEALVRLRAQAFLRGVTTTELAWEVVERRVSLRSPEWQDPPSRQVPGGLGGRSQ